MPYRLGLALLLAILRPADRSVVPPGEVSVIAQAEGSPELKLDGKPLVAKRPAAGVLTVTIQAAAGMHELSLGSEKARFFAGRGAPEGWKEFRAHPPAGGCDACHAVRDGAWEIKGGAVGDNCFTCHDAKVFPRIHQHNPEVLVDCQLCHWPHGSTAKAHLRMAKETACKQCHG